MNIIIPVMKLVTEIFPAKKNLNYINSFVIFIVLKSVTDKLGLET